MHVKTKSGRHARWRTLPLHDVAVTGGFWLQKQTVIDPKNWITCEVKVMV